MSEKDLAGSQVPLFEGVPEASSEPEQMELQFHLSLIKGAKRTVRSPALRRDRREAELGNVVGTVCELTLQRRNRLNIAGTYFDPPGPKSVMEWFKLYSPDDQGNDALDEFLRLLLLHVKVPHGNLQGFLDMISKGVATRKASSA